MMYYKEENGKRIWLHNILILDNKQIINPTEDQILTAGYIKYEEKIVEDIDTIKEDVINNIIRYDNSEAINSCYINYNGSKIKYWASKSERNDLKTALNDCLNMGKDVYRLDLRDLKISIILDCKELLNILSSLEIYAIECYNKTTDHIFAVQQLIDIETVKNYNYRLGYPEILTFNVK